MKSFSRKIEDHVVKKFLNDIAITLDHWTSMVEHQAVAGVDFSLPLRQVNYLRLKPEA